MLLTATARPWREVQDQTSLQLQVRSALLLVSSRGRLGKIVHTAGSKARGCSGPISTPPQFPCLHSSVSRDKALSIASSAWLRCEPAAASSPYY